MALDWVKDEKMLRMARAFAGAGSNRRRKNPQHSWTRGYIAGLEEALALGDRASIQAKLDETIQKLADLKVRRSV